MSGSQLKQFDEEDENERSVEAITRAASHGYWPEGSRVADSAKLHSRRETQMLTSAGRMSIPNPSALEMLPAENISPQSFDIELDEYGSDGASDYTSAESEFEELNLIPDPAEVARERQAIRERRAAEEEMLANQRSNKAGDSHAMLDLVKFDDEEDDDELVDDLSSEEEEEPQIIRALKDQITDQMRQEMRSELAVYKLQQDKLKEDDKENKEPDLEFEGMDPKLKEAILKMRKYDRILLKKMKKEKQVKRDRILLQRRLREELDGLRPEGRDEQREVLVNTQKFLSLAPPPPKQTNQTDSEFESPPVTPVFQTQFIDPSTDQGMNSTASNVDDHKADKTDSSLGGDGRQNTNESSRSSHHQSDHKRKRKDYIKRNIELASDAANVIAMTDDEKKRVEDLLSDLDALPEYEDAPYQGDNPYQIILTSGEGYQPSAEELRRLEEIDDRLRAILPVEDFHSIASTTPRDKASQQSFRLFARSDVMSSLEEEQPGDAALKDARDGRSLQQRLHLIEQELAHLTTAVDLEIESPTLSENQLNELLEQCSRTMSRATEETNSLASTTPQSLVNGRSSCEQITPSLPDDVLQRLLSQARSELRLTESVMSDNEDDTTSNIHTPQNNERDLLVESVTDEDLLRESVHQSNSASSSSLNHPNSKHYYQGKQGTIHHDHQLNLIANLKYSNKTESHIPDRCSALQADITDRRPFLPEINTNVSLSTQPVMNSIRLNNESSYISRPSSSNRASTSRASALSIRNSFSENDIGYARMVDEVSSPSPHPPASDRRQSSAERSRNVSMSLKKDGML